MAAAGLEHDAMMSSKGARYKALLD